MEKITIFLIPGMMAVVLFRLLVRPVQLGLKLAAHSACGFLCLWILNLVAPFSGIWLPVNMVTMLVSGFLGIPGICMITLLTVL